MKCISPILAAWYKPQYQKSRPLGYDSHWSRTVSGFTGIDKPLFYTNYFQAEDMTPSEAFGLPSAFDHYLEWIVLPCGHCISCRLNLSSYWVARNIMESRYYDRMAFVTLTVDDCNIEGVFPGGSLTYSPFQDFIRSLRQTLRRAWKKEQQNKPKKDRLPFPDIRYYMCGEYGSMLQRPHYHAIIYGYDFPDRQIWSVRGGIPIYVSSMLQKHWKFGFSTCSDVTQGSIQYVCRYVLKKIVGNLAAEHYHGRQPEFTRMSLKPGIGARFMDEFCGKDFYKCGLDGRFVDDYVDVSGRRLKPPRYFDKIYDVLDSSRYERLKAWRRSQSKGIFVDSVSELHRKAEYLSTVINSKRLSKGVTNV